jgi:hypothetical protein
LQSDARPQLRKAIGDKDSGIRYWGTMGVFMRGKDAVSTARTDLQRALNDPAPTVRIVAAEALARFGELAIAPQGMICGQYRLPWDDL